MKTKALMVFTVSYGGIRLKVRVLPTVRDVHREYEANHIDGKALARKGKNVEGFFTSTRHGSAKHIGTILLPAVGYLDELIPHEVFHVVMHKFKSVHCDDDEAAALAVGALSARIARKIARGMVYE